MLGHEQAERCDGEGSIRQLINDCHTPNRLAATCKGMSDDRRLITPANEMSVADGVIVNESTDHEKLLFLYCCICTRVTDGLRSNSKLLSQMLSNRGSHAQPLSKRAVVISLASLPSALSSEAVIRLHFSRLFSWYDIVALDEAERRRYYVVGEGEAIAIR